MKMSDGISILEMDDISAIIKGSKYNTEAVIYFKDGRVVSLPSFILEEFALYPPEPESEESEG